MGYFSNSTEGESYEAQYCVRCVHHNPDDGGCPVFLAHLLYNYAECNKRNSILHMLIPINKEGTGNEQCAMFHEDKHKPHPDQYDFLGEALNSGDGTYRP